MQTNGTKGRSVLHNRLLPLLVSMAALMCGTAFGADFTVVNNCSYTVYPGIYPASYANGGW